MLGGAAQAQTAAATPAPGAGLRQQLSDLAANPQSVNELVATGRAALAMGDGQGALGFFTRAQELDAGNARVKAGLAAANVRIGRAETALTLFAEAIAAGAPEAELRADRGLAYDMVGQTARAQQDYLAALRHRDDAEVRRRLALSLAISGQREAALRLLAPQLAGGDRASQRARIMVLALSGDTRGATAAASSALTAQQAGALTPFLTRIAALSPGDMAAAANLGRVPGNGAVRQAAARSEADPAALAFAGGGTTALPARLPVAVADATPRRRPGGVTGNAAARDAGRPRGSWTNTAATIAVRPPAATSSAAAGAPNALVLPHPHEPLRINAAALEQSGLAGAERVEPRVPAATVEAAPAAARPIQLASAQPGQGGPVYQPEDEPAGASQPAADEDPADGAAANLAVWNRGATATATPARVESRPAAPVQAVARREPVQTSTPEPTPTPRRSTFSDVAASVSALPTETNATAETPRRATPAARTSTRDRAATPRTTSQAPTASVANRAGTTATARTANPRTANPERIWVQLGVSNNRAGFGYEMTRMRRLAPELARQTAHTAPIGNSHRLLVGPFPTDAAARTFINTLRTKDIQSMAWTSSAGTQVERLPAGR